MTNPFVGALMIVTELISKSPSRSVSFSGTLTLTGTPVSVDSESSTATGGAVIVTVTRAISHCTSASQISYSKVSVPTKLALGVYVTTPVAGLTDTDPLVGLVTIETLVRSRLLSGSVSFAGTSITRSVLAKPAAESSIAIGTVLVVMVIVTVAVSHSPSVSHIS